MKRLFGRRRESITETARKNITTVAEIEQELLGQRSGADRLSDTIARLAGNIYFALGHALAVAGWVLLNTGVFPGILPFDPFPFPFLGLVVALEAIFLSMFVLMSQNRQRRHTDHWDHLNLQIDLLAEQEMTKMLQMLQKICRHLGLEKEAGDPELKEMVQTTPVEVIAQEISKVRQPGATEPAP